MEPTAQPSFTIGHFDFTNPGSHRAAEVRQAEVQFVADVRAIPQSRTNPQCNSKRSSRSTVRIEIGYAHIAASGGPARPYAGHRAFSQHLLEE
jgi:hypothetical protein